MITSEADLLVTAQQIWRLKALDVDEYYEHHIKPPHSDIIEFISLTQAKQLARSNSAQLAALRHASRHIVEAVKDMKYLDKNLSRYLLVAAPVQRQQGRI